MTIGYCIFVNKSETDYISLNYVLEYLEYCDNLTKPNCKIRLLVNGYLVD